MDFYSAADQIVKRMIGTEEVSEKSTLPFLRVLGSLKQEEEAFLQRFFTLNQMGSNLILLKADNPVVISSLSQLIPMDAETRLACEALLDGKKVFVYSNYQKKTQHLPGLRNFLLERDETLKKLGFICIDNVDQIPEYLGQKKDFSVEKEQFNLAHKKLLTGRDIQHLGRHTELVLNRDCILTPLAREESVRRGITLRFL